jgi:N-glycosyltransferase
MRVLIGTQPLPGHFRPLAPLATCLKERGHDVLFVTSEFFVPTIEAFGFSARPVGSRDPLRLEAVVSEMGRTSTSVAEADVFVLAGETARAAVPDVARVVDEWRPTVVLRDSAEFATYVAAERFELPHVTVSTSLAASLYNERQRYSDAINHLRRDAGLEPDPDCTSLFRYLHLEFMPRQFFTGAGEIPPRTVFLRQTNVLGPGDLPPSWLGELDSRPTVLVNFGTLAREPQSLLRVYRALRQLPINILLKHSEQDAGALERVVARNIRVGSDISPTAALPACALFVTHAGFNAVKEALSLGVPLLTVPLFGDQFFISQRCHELGLAAPVDPARPAELRSAVEAALRDSTLQGGVQRIREEMIRLPPLDAGAALVEEVAIASRPLP